MKFEKSKANIWELGTCLYKTWAGTFLSFSRFLDFTIDLALVSILITFLEAMTKGLTKRHKKDRVYLAYIVPGKACPQDLEVDGQSSSDIRRQGRNSSP